LISVVVPTYNSPRAFLEKAVSSVEQQTYTNWELCLVDDCSTLGEVQSYLRHLVSSNPKIRAHFRNINGNISASSNDGVRMARGEFVAFLDHDDELTEDALEQIVDRLNDKPQTDVIYSDQDKISPDGVYHEPFFKPDWSPEYLVGVMYVGHLLVVRRSLLIEVGLFDGAYDNVQDYELMLRLAERTTRIEHIQKILYHWRQVPGSVAASLNGKPHLDRLHEEAAQQHLVRRGVPALTVGLGGHRARIVPRPRSAWPLVSIMVPTRDRPELIERCLKSLFEQTSYPEFEVIVGDNETIDPAALAVMDRFPIRKLHLPGPFHFARFNNRMAAEARGDYLVLLNNDTEVIRHDWIQHLLLFAELSDVGAAGPLLLYPNGSVQHAGVILGPRGTADHVSRGFSSDADGYAGSLSCTREVSAVTGACLMVQRHKFQACGGLNEEFRRHYEDVDFCMRLRKRGFRIIYVAGTALIHHESMTRGSLYSMTDRALLLDYWEPDIQRGDPYYNSHFDPQKCDYSLRAGRIAP
jgi:GT2 family glycosyltransferase